MKEKNELSLLSLKAKIFLALNILAILIMLSFTVANAQSFDDCKTEPFLLWNFPQHKYCFGGDYSLFICLDENSELIFVPTCTSSFTEENYYGIFLPLVIE